MLLPTIFKIKILILVPRSLFNFYENRRTIVGVFWLSQLEGVATEMVLQWFSDSGWVDPWDGNAGSSRELQARSLCF